MLNYVKAVLNFSAFRPEPDDPQFSWKARFAGQSTVLLSIGRNSLGFTVVDGKGEAKFGERRRGELRDVFVDLAPVIKENATNGWCAVSLDTRYVITIETNLSRKRGSELALKKDPRSVLHVRYERGKAYAITHNPETNSSLLLSYDAEFIQKMESTLKERGLKVGRMFCGTYVLLRHALTVTNDKKGSDNPFSALYVTSCGGSICALLQEKDHWLELRSRPDVITESLEPLSDLLSPFGERFPAGAPLVVACDEPVPGFPEKLGEIFPGREVRDLTKPGFLVSLIYDN